MPQLIETLRTEPDGSIPLLALHMRRLRASAELLGYVCPVCDIGGALKRCAQSLPGEIHRLRLLLWRTGLYTIETSPLPPQHAHLQVGISDTLLDADEPYLRHKTTHRPVYTPAGTWLAQHPDLFDVLFFNQRGELCEGSRSNVYLRLADGKWYTPPVESGLLPGVQRSALLESGAVQERTLSRHDLNTAQGIRLSNALRGWFDVSLASARFVHTP